MNCLPSMGLWAEWMGACSSGVRTVPCLQACGLPRPEEREIRVTPVRHHRFLSDYFLLLFLAEPNFCATEPDRTAGTTAGGKP